jgi:hypothetical protein
MSRDLCVDDNLSRRTGREMGVSPHGDLQPVRGGFRLNVSNYFVEVISGPRVTLLRRPLKGCKRVHCAGVLYGPPNMNSIHPDLES